MRKKKYLAPDETAGHVKGEFISPVDLTESGHPPEDLPKQEDFWRPPTRFGSIPVEKEPLGWDRRRRDFVNVFPYVGLPLQVVDRVSFGHPELPPNRLFWGDNLHVMRQLPSESIDLIYIDPPFFSGRQYNVIFGDQNELRSFSDIWEGGMPGYLIWLNARLYEMKRLLKKNGSIYIHLSWHAVHYVKIEMDKMFGYNFNQNHLIWNFGKFRGSKNRWKRDYESILYYTRSNCWTFNCNDVLDPYQEATERRFDRIDESGKRYKILKGRKIFDQGGVTPSSVWRLSNLQDNANEKIGYPTQKPESLLERIILASSSEGDFVADFFCGGGTTPAVAQRLNRRWIASDQSRVAVAITADRISKMVEEKIGRVFPVPDFTVEHWGVYEAGRLSQAPADQFRQFVLKAFGATVDDKVTGIHGYKAAVPVWVGEPGVRSQVTAKDVEAFGNAIRRTIRYKQDNLRDGIMLAWAFRPDAADAAERLKKLENTDVNFIRLDMIRIDSPRFREHVSSLSTKHADYQNFLTFVQPPRVEVGWKRIAPLFYKFDVSESVVLNSGAKIINVQWDFKYEKRFTSAPGFSFIRTAKKEPVLLAEYEFPHAGTHRIACKVQDDMGGEGLWTGEVNVE